MRACTVRTDCLSKNMAKNVEIVQFLDDKTTNGNNLPILPPEPRSRSPANGSQFVLTSSGSPTPCSDKKSNNGRKKKRKCLKFPSDFSPHHERQTSKLGSACQDKKDTQAGDQCFESDHLSQLMYTRDLQGDFKDCDTSSNYVRTGHEHIQRPYKIKQDAPNTVRTDTLLTQPVQNGAICKRHTTNPSDLEPCPANSSILSQMADAKISRLIEQGHEALTKHDHEGAKKFVQKALVVAEREKDNFLMGLNSTVTEQQLADWFGGCSFILNETGNYLSSTKCFYTATIFDPSWNALEHLKVADTLWGSLVYSVPHFDLHMKYKRLLDFLFELDRLAKLAEQRKRWHVSLVIDGDINKIHVHLRVNHGIGPENIRQHPGRKEALWRTARCFLALGIHQQVRTICGIILEDGYDNAEAFEMWSRSLFMSEEYELALKKCIQGLECAKDETERAKLQQLKTEIEEKHPAQEPIDERQIDETWLEGFVQQGKSSPSRERPDTPENGRARKKKRHKRPKARSRSVSLSASTNDTKTSLGNSVAETLGKSQTILYSRETTPRSETGSSDRQTPPDHPAVRRLQQDRTKQRSRYVSGSSTVSEMSAQSYECSLSDMDSDGNDDDNDTASSSSLTNMSYTVDEVVEQHEDTSFYEQSCSFHQHHDLPDETEAAVTDEKLLKHGLSLNAGYLQNFEDRHPDILKRNLFYSETLSESALKEKLLQNPKKYIRCTIQIEGSHEAVCTPIDTNLDCSVIEISGRSKIGQVFNEDEVVVELLDEKASHEKRYGKVLGVLNRQRHKNVKHPVFICTLDDLESHLVRPMCKTLPKIHIVNKEITKKFPYKMKRFKVEIYEYDDRAGILCNPKIVDVNPAGHKTYVLMVAFISWSPIHVYPIGAVIKMLPWGNNIPRGLMILNLQHEVPTLYTKKTVDRVESITRRCVDEPDVHALKGRLDLTQLNTFTIDPPDARDLDDALSIEQHALGYKIGVHIADVSFYVRKDDPIDEEARQRATTFYPGIRKPRCMIPEPLSSNLCSLLPDKKRLTMSIFFYLDSEGRPVQMEGNNFEICETYIQSKRKFSYGEVQKILKEEPNNDPISKDVCRLFKVAKKIRKRRLGNAMFALDVDWEENLEEESMTETAEAHYLVEEYMVMANKKVAEVLIRKFPTLIPIRCQPPPNKEGLEEFVKKNGNFIDVMVRMQDKNIAGVERGVELILNQDNINGLNIVVGKETWVKMKRSPVDAAKVLQQDDLFPLQHVVYQHWLSLQERAGYRCSGSVGGKESGIHYSLGYYPYTHFTSPIRRYNDLVIHRLLRALLHGMGRDNCPYTKLEIDNICVHMNSATRKSKEYQKGCKSLQQAIEYHENPPMLSSFVDDVTDRGISLCSPMFKHVRKTNRELTFNLLDMGHKPEVFEDQATKWNSVKATWRKRVYDHQGKPPSYPPDRGHLLKLNANKNTLYVPLASWARILKAATEGRYEDLKGLISRASAISRGDGLDDVSTECLDLELLQPSTKFSMTYSRGQTVTVQMSAAPYKGMLVPRPMLYKMTNNVCFCLQHTEDPVLHLYRYVTTSTCDQYKNVKQYLQRWLPLMLMEAATGIVKSEESCCINNVPVKFTNERKGKFALSLAHCDTRNIELSGTQSDDEDDPEDNDRDSKKSYDWLCLKAPMPKTDNTTQFTENNPQVHQRFWVGHAEVNSVVKKKDSGPGGKLTVSFELHEKAKPVPFQIRHGHQEAKYSVEILRKSEVDRRTESFIKTLPANGDGLATKIALNKKIPDLDDEHKRIAKRMKRDLYYEASADDPKRRPLPKNNEKQQEAVNKALESRFTLIQGPPGTGKTYTGIKLIYLFNEINKQLSSLTGKPKKQVLFCGPSNKSVDLVAKWMYYRMGTYRPKFVRVYGRSIEAMEFPIPGRTFFSKKSTHNLHADHELKDVALHHLIRQKGKKHAEEITALDKLFKDNNYAPMPEEVRRYVHMIREASIDVIREHDVILCTTAVGSNPKVLEATTVHQVIVDEAGMCPEPQCLVPIIATKAEQVVLIGDHKQLRPIIICREAGQLGLETSLFERYAMTNSSSNVQFVMLEQQYRMHPAICYFPSKQFYGGDLVTEYGLWRGATLNIWPSDQYGPHPHVLVHVEGEEKMLTVSTEDGNEQSKSNTAEIDYVVQLYKYMVTQAPNESVFILSQYNAQCSEIKKRLLGEGYDDQHVSTVVSSQGGEWDYVIFSTVRSLPDYKIEKNPTLGWCKHNLGFITDQNQVNVALTRARKGHIIVGNRNLLACDVVLKKLVEHYDRHGCIHTPATFPPPKVLKTRQQIMNQAQDINYRRYGETIFQKGVATSYVGSFDDDEGAGRGRGRGMRRPPPRHQ